MRIHLNNREELLDTTRASLTVSELLVLKRYSFPHLVVRINGILIKRNQYASAFFQDGDRVEVIHLISGG
ncbi:MAG: sulfur carrier protein ThiS [bacterium]